jgi:sugar/nucleoside kinase (ribokinase family)
MRNAPVSEKAPVGVFVGSATLDVIHRIAKTPAVNEKITATAQFVAAGGPAANAAVTFARLGGDANLVTAPGDDPVAEVIRADLGAYGVNGIVPHATDMLCSNDFRMQGTDNPESTAAALVRSGVRAVVSTHGGDPVEWWSDGKSGSVPVEPVVVVDTLGAGDAFHGVYSYFSTQIESSVAERIDRSAGVAALRCSVVGPRAWLSELRIEQTRKRER